VVDPRDNNLQGEMTTVVNKRVSKAEKSEAAKPSRSKHENLNNILRQKWLNRM
jgi:hypothetical protein